MGKGQEGQVLAAGAEPGVPGREAVSKTKDQTHKGSTSAPWKEWNNMV